MKKTISLFLTLIIALVLTAPAIAGGNSVTVNDVVINGGAIAINQNTIDGNSITNLTVTNDSENYDILFTTSIVNDETGEAIITKIVFNNPNKNVPLYSPLHTNDYIIINDDVTLEWYKDDVPIKAVEETIPSTSPNGETVSNGSVYTMYTAEDVNDEYVIIECDINGNLILTWYTIWGTSGNI